MPLRHHRGADQNIDFASMHGIEGLLRAAFSPRRIGIYAHDARVRKNRLQTFFYSLRTAPQRLQIHIAAIRAGLGNPLLITTMMATQAAVELVQNQKSAAALDRKSTRMHSSH